MKRLILLVALAVTVVGAGLALAMPEGPMVSNPDRTFEPVTMPSTPTREYLIVEDFESDFPPAGWTTMTTGASTTWEQSSRTANSGLYSAAIIWGTAWQDEWLVTPALNTTGLTTLTLAWAEAAENQTWFREHDVMVSTTVPDDPAAFTTVLELTPDNHTIGHDWQAVTVDLTPYVGFETVYVALRYQGAYADTWYLDDVLIYQPFDHEVAAVKVSPVGATIFPQVEVTPEMTVKNFGGNTETFDVNMVVTHDGAVVLDETLTVTDLAASELATVAFPTFVTEPGYYVLTGTVLLAGDEYPGNDMAVGGVHCVSSERTPLGVLFTNWGCHPCVDANMALDEWYALQGNQASLVRVHVYWPVVNDPMYQANPDQCQWMLDMCPATVMAAPTLYMDNTWDMWDYYPGDWVQATLDGYLMSANTPSALTIPHLGYNAGTGEVEVMVDVPAALDPLGDYRLYVAITEDGIYAPGPNGETVHNQAFRYLFPDTEGVQLLAEAGTQSFTVPVTLDPGWVFENLRATVWVMESPNGVVLNSGTVFLAGNAASAVEDDQPDVRVPSQLRGAFPNPFNPRTEIRLALNRDQAVKLAIYDLAGHRLAELVDQVMPAGEHALVWNGRNAAGQDVPSGIYFAHMVSEDGIEVSKLMLIR